ncbi:flagellar motor switch protein FliM [Sphingomonas sp. CJ99]
MVNDASPSLETDRRSRPRIAAEHALALGISNVNPFGDLHTLQHLSARFARSLRGVFEPMLRRAVRSWAEPVEVERFGQYRANREMGLTAWLPVAMTPDGGQALMVVPGRFALELLDLFFGGFGDAPHSLPTEFSPAAEAVIRRMAASMCDPLAHAWEPVARIGFTPGNIEINAAMLSSIDSEDPVIVTRFGIAADGGHPAMIDILYPVAALKPHGPSLTAKVHGKSAEPDARWLAGLTRAAMGVRFPVRSVLAEPSISLGKLMELKEGDIIPISFGPNVPVMVGNRRLGAGTVGTANGHAAIRLTSIEPLPEEDFQ